MSSISTQSSPDTDSPSSDDILSSFRPFITYSQSQILWLYKSPLVSPPNGMPSLKDWFGYASSFMHFAISEPWHTLGTGMSKTSRKRILTPLLPPQERGTNGALNLSLVSPQSFSPSILASGVIKKRLVESPSLFSAFTRSLATLSADLPPRTTFRSTLSQPSQMGNFKHQSIRTSDRERDKDADRDRERDLRDKEGQERLRSVSSLS